MVDTHKYYQEARLSEQPNRNQPTAQGREERPEVLMKPVSWRAPTEHLWSPSHGDTCV